MQQLDPSIRAEYERWMRLIGPDDPYEGPRTVGIAEVLRAHFLIVDHFASHEHEGIGGIGPRDLNLLHSAVGRQHCGFDGRQKWTDPYSLAATLFYGLILDHPFHDANKRTAFLVALHQLQHVGRVPNCAARHFERLAVDVARHELGSYREYDAVRGQDDPDVRFIARFFRSRTRQLDKQQYLLTYRQLDGVLRRFGYELGNPSGNYIDVLRIVEEPIRRLFVSVGTRAVRKRVAQIGFPGWKSQVGKAAMAAVRKATGLTHEKGFDSQVFFQDVDPLESLIPAYHGSLQRLADR